MQKSQISMGLIIGLLISGFVQAAPATAVSLTAASGQVCTIVGTDAAQTLNGTAGNDVICGLGGNDIINGLGGNDIIDGGSGNDNLSGGSGNDTLIGGIGNDSLNGGNDTDTVSYVNAPAGVAVDLSKTTQQNTVSAGLDTIGLVENIIGGNANDILTGNTGANSINAGNGNDTLSGGAGNDILTGGAGIDTVSYSNAPAGVAVDLSKTNQQNTVSAGNDTFSGDENIIGGNGNDILTGDGLANVINAGNGNDVVNAGIGNDVLVGGAGTDTLNGGVGTDTVSYFNAPAGVAVDLSKTTQQYTVSAGYDTLAGDENVTGGNGNDILTGNNANNVLSGGIGNDVMSGMGGNDRLNGEEGNDKLQGGVGADTLTGFSGNDELDGGANPDSLDGGSGTNLCLYTAEDIVAPNCDSTPPNYSSVTYPPSVDTSVEAKVVTITLNVTDNLAGVACAFITLSGPGNQLIQNGCASRISGDALSGRYQALLTLPRYSQAGTWKVMAELGDTAENRKQVQIGTVTQLGAQDTQAPEFSSVSAPASVDTSVEAKVVTITLNVTDNLAGVACAFITLSGPGNQLIQNGCASRISGDALSGRYQALLTLPRYSQAGTWKVMAELGDTAENRKQVQIGTVTQLGAQDTQAPEFSSVSAPASVDTSVEAKVVTITLNVTDNLAGVACAFITLSGPGNQLIQNGCASRISGDALSGRYQALLTLPRYSQAGTWKVMAELGDTAENRKQVQIGTVQVGVR